jgi:hypothetical protein
MERKGIQVLLEFQENQDWMGLQVCQVVLDLQVSQV